MCGRFTLRRSFEYIAAYFKAHGVRAWSPRYNIAPTQDVLCVVPDAAGDRQWATFRWGLVPSWLIDSNVTFSNINARCENVAKSPAFRSAFKNRRCLIPADGFYEWVRREAVAVIV
jgi:putative SOS response-associated peptidase YedK